MEVITEELKEKKRLQKWTVLCVLGLFGKPEEGLAMNLFQASY